MDIIILSYGYTNPSKINNNYNKANSAQKNTSANLENPNKNQQKKEEKQTDAPLFSLFRTRSIF